MLNLHPDDPHSYHGISRSYAYLQDYDQAIEYLRKASELDEEILELVLYEDAYVNMFEMDEFIALFQ